MEHNNNIKSEIGVGPQQCSGCGSTISDRFLLQFSAERTTKDSCDGESSPSSSKSKTKRVRTTFTDEQLQILQANFQIDSNPDGQDLERIAQITGLSKRVTQVWFQNSRARQKKHMTKQKKTYHHGSSSFEKTSAASQLSDSDSTAASPLTMLYSFK
ncbi:unnamed protein product [Allacma fusca]|uniref:Homeobox domain-containing protein n=1 Tax=Allacma fusca TaxID=39272 RepID=A0A8J2KS81_9HEXA|nr:unnamed protein product [Allacma fusca]